MGSACRDNTSDANRHPCYSADAQHKFARLHLPVAPSCNISCNYCNRKFDCVNESRPGVTSEVLAPESAKDKFLWVKGEVPNLSVVGIAGPGDALANWENTKRSLELIRQEDPEVIFCLSTNGLMLPEYAAEIIALGIGHVTVTVNSVDPEIGAKLYRHVNYQGKSYHGVEAAKLLSENQLAGISLLVAAGVLVKVNIVMVPGVNDQHIPLVVKKVKDLGVFVTNIMPMIPAPGSAFEQLPQTSMREVNAMRDLCQLDIRQMRHCRQCRADAVGLLGEDRSAEFRMGCREQEPAKVEPATRPYKIAVTSKNGKLVDLHFGHTTDFMVYQAADDAFELLERRQVAKYCDGPAGCDESEDGKEAIAQALSDCDAVLTMRIGHHAIERLRRHGVKTIESCYTIEHGLKMAVEELHKDNISS
ncbi:MAG: nitrogenase cofactor biosynthesis protein NifB [Negativicutes bacterium]|nr:nitrogenase cofactor biosynthesis protein NifB [Negativicutes bacterium]